MKPILSLIILLFLILFCKVNCNNSFKKFETLDSRLNSLHTKKYESPFHVKLGPNSPLVNKTMETLFSSPSSNLKSSYLNVGIPKINNNNLNNNNKNNGGEKWFDFAPTFVGSLSPNQNGLTKWVTNHCSYSAMVDLYQPSKQNNNSGSKAIIRIKAHPLKENQFICGDFHIFTTIDSFHIHDIETPGYHEIEIQDLTNEQIHYINQVGIKTFIAEQSVLNTVIDLWHLYQLFGSQNAPKDQVIKFLETHMGLKPEKRPNAILNLTESHLQPGDVIVYWSIAGHDDLILYGTGSHATHTAVILPMEDGHMYVCESTNPVIKKTRFDKWLQGIHSSINPRALLRLKPEVYQHFNHSKAVEIFKQLEGTPYGFQNFVFGWIDTPTQNFPHPLTPQLAATGLWMFSKIIPDDTDLIFGQALNQRLGNYNCCPRSNRKLRHPLFKQYEDLLISKSLNQCTNQPECLSMDKIFETMANRNISFESITTMPEQDSWNYHTGKSLVCDSMVLFLFKHSGLFRRYGIDPSDIQATEFTPKDLYNLGIFTPDPHAFPSPCRSKLSRYSKDGYCQFSGEYWLTLPYFNSIKPYAHMNQHCGAMPIKYIRKPSGC